MPVSCIFGPAPSAGHRVKHPKSCHSFCLFAFGPYSLFIDISYFSPFDFIPFLPSVTHGPFVFPFQFQRVTALLPTGRLAYFVSFQVGALFTWHAHILSFLPSLSVFFCNTCAYIVDVPVIEPDTCFRDLGGTKSPR